MTHPSKKNCHQRGKKTRAVRRLRKWNACALLVKMSLKFTTDIVQIVWRVLKKSKPELLYDPSCATTGYISKQMGTRMLKRHSYFFVYYLCLYLFMPLTDINKHFYPLSVEWMKKVRYQNPHNIIKSLRRTK